MRRFGAWPAWAFMALFFAVPLAALLPEAFGDGGSAFARLFGNPLFLGALRNTLALGLAQFLMAKQAVASEADAPVHQDIIPSDSIGASITFAASGVTTACAESDTVLAVDREQAVGVDAEHERGRGDALQGILDTAAVAADVV